MASSEKKRLDILVYEKGFADSREKAKALIMEGLVLVNGEREDKPGSAFSEDVTITLKGRPLPYVSRGGLKLEKAVRVFGIDLKDKICMDAGASTGGFTDCMLQNGAAKVYSVDVGYGQLDWKLRNDERVVCMEKTNIRYLTPEQIPDRCSFASIDVSFISLKKILPPVVSILSDEGEIAALIKPQFEAGREKVGKKGVVKDPAVHREVIREIAEFALSCGLFIKHLDYSPVKGPEGNIEYLIHLSRIPSESDLPEEKIYDTIGSVVSDAHSELDR